MRRSRSNHAGRTVAGALLFTLAILLLCSVAFIRPRAQLPTGGDAGQGSISPGGQSLNWNQVTPVTTPGGNVNTEAACVEGVNCEHYVVTITGTQADWAAAAQKVHVGLKWSDGANEYDLYIHQGADGSGAVVASSINGPGVTAQAADIDIAAHGTGQYYVHVVFDLNPDPADHYSGSISAVPLQAAPPPAAPQDNHGKVGYENFEAPGVLLPASQLSSGGVTVEYMGRGAGEPSVGANWVTKVINFQSDLQTLFITFADDLGTPCDLSKPKATWVNRRAPTSQFIDSDPIGFTDHTSGGSNRVFASELTLLSPDTVKISHTDNDGVTWVADQTGGIASAVDHQTIGGGPYAILPTNPVYPHAIYYCSQDIAAALCSRSDDGGVTYGPSVPIYSLLSCGGLHGHVKVAPDGTVYVPNRACGSNSAVVVSTNNGTSWSVRPIQNGAVPRSGASDDPAVAIDKTGRVYALFALNGSVATVGVSIDQGQNWPIIYDVGANLGLTNVAFPAATAGDDGRAAVAFYGAKGGTGNSSDDTYTGVWHLYVAHTFDGGNSWTTTDVTPSLPMQRMGLLRGGGGPIDRNLLDFFDITTDVNGRVVVGYVNGCTGGDCSQAPVNPDGSTSVIGNTYSATATIARQSSGRRMFAANDPNPLTSAPGMPFVTVRRVGQVVHLAWNEADPGNNGGSPADQTITSFQVLRGTTPGGENATPLATLPGTASRYDDTTATNTSATYYYKVVATNSIGSSCPNNEVAAPYLGNTCTGLVIHQNLPNNPEATGGSETTPPIGPTPTPTASPAATPPIPPQYLIDYIAVGEPPDHADQLMFKMKVRDLSTVPANSRWRMVWGWVGNNQRKETLNPDEQFYVGMTTDGNSNVTFEYGTVQTLSLVVVGVPTENMKGNLTTASVAPDGTITMFVDKSKVGSPAPGDILAAINGRTFNTGDTAGGPTTERSTLLVDHTFIKGNTDNSYPPATYTVAGNVACEAAGANTPPFAVLKATPTSGAAPLTVTFDASGSYDPDFGDTIRTYTFDFGDGTATASGGSPVATHTYTSAGTFTARVVVTDSRGATNQNADTDHVFIQVTGGATPTPSPSPIATVSPTVTPKPAPGITTQASGDIVLGGSISDTATLSGGSTPTGNITFQLFGPDDATCGGGAIFTSTVAVNGDGNYPSGSFTPTKPGTYRWVATYSGDSANSSANTACNDANESVVVSSSATPTPSPTATPKTPSLTTHASGNTALGGSVSDTASLAGGSSPTGNITFQLFGPDDPSCGTAAVFSSTIAVNGAGDYTSASFTPSTAGTYRWVATYSGDAANRSVSTHCGDQDETVSLTANATPTPSPTPQPTPANVQLLNISGRVYVQSGENVGIGGFIITGNGTKRVMARALGPSLTVNGQPVSGRLQDPYLELHDSNGGVLVNDNWRSSQEAEIEQTGLAPSNDREAAIVKRLPAGNYTAIIQSADGSPGVGLIELYDLSSTEPGELGNLSVRAKVLTDDNVLIDGVILRGANPKRVLFRALGPELHDRGVQGELQDPVLEVYDENGALLRSNDNWKDAANAGDIQATGLAPTDDRESAVLLSLQAGNYTSVVRGVNRTTGVALNEIYKLTN